MTVVSGTASCNRRRLWRLPAGLAAGAAICAGTLGGAAAHPCDTAARAELDRLGVTSGTDTKTSFVDVTDGGRGGVRVVGYEAWTSLAACRGSIVTKFSRTCRVRESYASGDCRSTADHTDR